MERIDFLSIPFGTDSEGKDIELQLNLTSCSNAFISGRPGSGKTTLLRTIANNAINKYGEDNISVWCISCSGYEFIDLKRMFPSSLKVLDVRNEDGFNGVLLTIQNEMDERLEHYKKVGAYSYSDKHAECVKPRLLILVDDYVVDFLYQDAYYQSILERILRLSHLSSISIAIASQATIHKLMSSRVKDCFTALIELQYDTAKGEFVYSNDSNCFYGVVKYCPPDC